MKRCARCGKHDDWEEGCPSHARDECPMVWGMKTCSRCGKQGEWEEGAGVCPEYFGRTGDGYCPMFWDGMTRQEQEMLDRNEADAD